MFDPEDERDEDSGDVEIDYHGPSCLCWPCVMEDLHCDDPDCPLCSSLSEDYAEIQAKLQEEIQAVREPEILTRDAESVTERAKREVQKALEEAKDSGVPIRIHKGYSEA